MELCRPYSSYLGASIVFTALEQQTLLRPKDVAAMLGEGVTDRTLRSDIETLVKGGWLVRRGRGRSISYAKKLR
jgi:DeoR/GlpR family transcriptional regulator of sugar metabolism